ncbi:MAG: ribonuclease HI [Patescibacteria group bacterium]
MKKYFLFTDGACSGNPGKGGWAAILKITNTENSEKIIEERLFGAYERTTNNRMELMALIKGLENVEDGSQVNVFTDSQYIVNALTKGWLVAWQQKGWKTAGKKPVANKDLWQKVIGHIARLKISPSWVRGHDGHPENELCDKLAVDAYLKGPYDKDLGYLKSGMQGSML